MAAMLQKCVLSYVCSVHILWQFLQSQGSKDKLIVCHTNDIKLNFKCIHQIKYPIWALLWFGSLSLGGETSNNVHTYWLDSRSW